MTDSIKAGAILLEIAERVERDTTRLSAVGVTDDGVSAIPYGNLDGTRARQVSDLALAAALLQPSLANALMSATVTANTSSDSEKLRAALIQVAAIATHWIARIDRDSETVANA